MKINNLILIIVGLLIIGFGFWMIPNSHKEKPEVIKQVSSSSSLVSDKEIYDFGEVNIFGGVVTTDFLLTNSGPDDIVINGGTTSCGCTSASIGGISFGMHEKMNKDFIIPAGKTEKLTVIYDPLAHGPSGVGLAKRAIFLKTNSTIMPELEVRIKAMVIKTN